MTVAQITEQHGKLRSALVKAYLEPILLPITRQKVFMGSVKYISVDAFIKQIRFYFALSDRGGFNDSLVEFINYFSKENEQHCLWVLYRKMDGVLITAGCDVETIKLHTLHFKNVVMNKTIDYDYKIVND